MVVEKLVRTESTALVGLSQVNDIASCHHAPTSLVAVKLENSSSHRNV